MPELEGCHPPELRGAMCPNQVYRLPVDNFARSTGILADFVRCLPPRATHPGVPNARIAQTMLGNMRQTVEKRAKGVPNARTSACAAKACRARGYQMPERYFPMALTWCAIFGTGG